MRKKGSLIAGYIDKDYRKEKQWKEKLKNMKSSKNNITILDEHSREPLIIEKEDK